MKLVDAGDSKSPAARRAGSIPASGTIELKSSGTQTDCEMHALLILALAILFPVVHILGDWLFQFAEISPHISLIYLPAFLRILNLLVLGSWYGSLATFFGSSLLLYYVNDPLWLGLLNVACSCASPLAALFLFKLQSDRAVSLSSLKDLTVLILLYCLVNSLIHHAAWAVFDPSLLKNPLDAFWMFMGDLNGSLLGTYLIKLIFDRIELQKLFQQDKDQDQHLQG